MEKEQDLNHGSFRGAPQNFDIFIFRCDKSTTTNNVKSHMENNNIKVLDVCCVSSEESRYRSFHVSIEEVIVRRLWIQNFGLKVLVFDSLDVKEVIS
jgi:hypothetical protein